MTNQSIKRCVIVCSDGVELHLQNYAFIALLRKFFNHSDVAAQMANETLKYWEWDMHTTTCDFHSVTASAEPVDETAWGVDDFKVICLGALNTRNWPTMFINGSSMEVLPYLTQLTVAIDNYTDWRFVGHRDNKHWKNQIVSSSKLLYTNDGVYATRGIYNNGVLTHMYSDVDSLKPSESPVTDLNDHVHPTMVLLINSGLEAA